MLMMLVTIVVTKTMIMAIIVIIRQIYQGMEGEAKVRIWSVIGATALFAGPQPTRRSARAPSCIAPGEGP